MRSPFTPKPQQWAIQLIAQVAQIQKGITKLMAEVQLDESVITGAASSIEALVAADQALVAAVNTFLASPAVQQIPAADVTSLTQALADAGNAQTAAATAQAALVAATPAAPAPGS